MITDEQKEILKLKCIHEEEWEEYYISNDGQVFQPDKDENGKITKTAEEKYKEILIPSVQQPSAEEILRASLLKDNVAFKLQLAQQQKINANLLTQIAKLGGTQ